MSKPSPSVARIIDAIESFQTKRGKLKFKAKQPGDLELGEVPGSYLNALAFMKAWYTELGEFPKALATPHSRADARKLLKKYHDLTTELAFAASYAKLALQQEFPKAQGLMPTVRAGGIAVLTSFQQRQLSEGPKAVVAVSVGLDSLFDEVEGMTETVKGAADRVKAFVDSLRKPSSAEEKEKI